ncbi:MAG: hypothetical protein AAF549_07960 [Pseudomonadota bacterium]
MQNPITLNNLAVVDFYADRKRELTEDTKRWMDCHLSSKVIAAENCERRIWMGHESLLSSIPNLDRYRERRFYTGESAYSFALQYLSGIANPYGLDRPARDRFYLAAARMASRDAKFYKNFDDIIAKLTRDSGFIIANVCDNIQPIRPWLIARDIGGLKAGTKVLVIGELDDEDPNRISDVTQRMIVTANGGDAGAPSKLTCLTVDEDNLDVTEDKIENLKRQDKLRIAETEVIDEVDMARALDEADIVYVTFPLRKRPDFDAMLKYSWKQRARTDNVLMHVDVRERVNEACYRHLDQYIPASQLRKVHFARIKDYQAQKAQAIAIADDFASKRHTGTSPIRDISRYPAHALRA